MNQESGQTMNTVFLTGLVRCGSSWVGQVLGAGAGTRYVYEPLNSHWSRRLAPHWRHFRYLRADDEPPPQVVKVAEDAFRGRQSTRGLVRAAYRGYLWSALRPAQQVLVKDPTACLAAAWLHQRFRPRMLLVTRHPCGFASSVHLHGWRVRLRALLRQADLVEDYLAPHTDFLRQADRDEWLGRGAFWGAVHLVLLDWWSRHADWLQVSYEALCAEPHAAFDGLARACGLGWSRSELDRTLTQGRPDDADSGSTRRDAARMAEVWRERLSSGQVDAVMGAVQALGLRYEDGVLSGDDPS